MPHDEPKQPVRSSAIVAIIGRPNVGKSTFLNAAIGEKLAIVSPVAQTTRHRILGVVQHGDVQLSLLDTPGIHKPHSRLGRALNAAARAAAREADVIVFVTDVPARAEGTLRPHPGDRTLLSDLGQGLPTILVINKVDRLKNKGDLLPLLQELARLRDFAAVVPISASRNNGLTRVLDEVAQRASRDGAMFEADTLTDRPARFFAEEFVREQILLATEKEVPHAAAVHVESFEEGAAESRIEATIHVERDGQRKILIGQGGSKLKAIGTAARAEIGRLLGQTVHLRLWVKVTPGWTDSSERVADFGYGQAP